MNTDLTLLTRYHRDGDAEAFQTLVQAHTGMVFYTARRITQDAALAEEVAQDTFLALAKRGQSVKDSVAAWLHHVARQKACNALRGELRRQLHEQAAAEASLEPQDGSWAEIEPMVDEVIDELPGELRSMLIEHFLEQRTQQEMARRLGMSQSTISRQIEAALRMMRDGLKHRGVVCGLGLAGLLGVHTAQAAPAGLVVSLRKIAQTGLRSGTGAAASSTLFTTMTTTTKALFSVAAVAAISVPLLLSRQQPSARPPAVAGHVSRAPVQARPLMSEPKPEPRQPSHEDSLPEPIMEERLTDTNDQQLILAEFKRIGGSIIEKFVDENIASIIRGQFNNDREALDRRLQEQGISFEEFKTQQRETIIVAVMKQRASNGIADPVARQRALEDWIANLRVKAGLPATKSTASGGVDE